MKGEKSLWIFRGFFGCYDKSDTSGDSQSFVNLVEYSSMAPNPISDLLYLLKYWGPPYIPIARNLDKCNWTPTFHKYCLSSILSGLYWVL